MKWMKSLINVTLAAMLLSATAGNATVLKFDLTGSYTASWELDSTRTPDAYSPGEGFVYFDVDGFPDAALGVADIYFYSEVNGGGLELYDFYGDTDLAVTDGPQFYTGPEASPIFNLGTFAMTEFGGSGTYLLTISEVLAPGAAVPEPATGALLLGGLGLMVALRRRKHAH